MFGTVLMLFWVVAGMVAISMPSIKDYIQCATDLPTLNRHHKSFTNTDHALS